MNRTLQSFSGRYILNIIEANDKIFSRYRGLHGNRFAFMRLLLADLLPVDKVVYLDSDLLIKLDIKSLFEIGLNGHVIGASGVGNVEWALERPFFLSIGRKPDEKYFNSGVLLMDLKQWRLDGVGKLCLSFADKHPDQLLTADQTVLNSIFSQNNFLELDEKFNRALYPDSRKIDLDKSNAIYHFVGSPKPWDYFVELVHGNYDFFANTLRKTEFHDYKTYLDISLGRTKRAVNLSRAYYRCISKRMFR